MGIVISLAVAGAIFQNRAVANAVRILPNIDITTLRNAITDTDSACLGSLPLSERTKVIEGIVKALSDVYIVVMFAGATVVVLAIFLPVSSFKWSKMEWLG